MNTHEMMKVEIMNAAHLPWDHEFFVNQKKYSESNFSSRFSPSNCKKKNILNKSHGWTSSIYFHDLHGFCWTLLIRSRCYDLCLVKNFDEIKNRNGRLYVIFSPKKKRDGATCSQNLILVHIKTKRLSVLSSFSSFYKCHPRSLYFLSLSPSLSH